MESFVEEPGLAKAGLLFDRLNSMMAETKDVLESDEEECSSDSRASTPGPVAAPVGDGVNTTTVADFSAVARKWLNKAACYDEMAAIDPAFSAKAVCQIYKVLVAVQCSTSVGGLLPQTLKLFARCLDTWETCQPPSNGPDTCSDGRAASSAAQEYIDAVLVLPTSSHQMHHKAALAALCQLFMQHVPGADGAYRTAEVAIRVAELFMSLVHVNGAVWWLSDSKHKVTMELKVASILRNIIFTRISSRIWFSQSGVEWLNARLNDLSQRMVSVHQSHKVSINGSSLPLRGRSQSVVGGSTMSLLRDQYVQLLLKTQCPLPLQVILTMTNSDVLVLKSTSGHRQPKSAVVGSCPDSPVGSHNVLANKPVCSELLSARCLHFAEATNPANSQNALLPGMSGFVISLFSQPSDLTRLQQFLDCLHVLPLPSCFEDTKEDGTAAPAVQVLSDFIQSNQHSQDMSCLPRSLFLSLEGQEKKKDIESALSELLYFLGIARFYGVPTLIVVLEQKVDEVVAILLKMSTVSLQTAQQGSRYFQSVAQNSEIGDRTFRRIEGAITQIFSAACVCAWCDESALRQLLQSSQLLRTKLSCDASVIPWRDLLLSTRGQHLVLFMLSGSTQVRVPTLKTGLRSDPSDSILLAALQAGWDDGVDHILSALERGETQLLFVNRISTLDLIACCNWCTGNKLFPFATRFLCVLGKERVDEAPSHGSGARVCGERQYLSACGLDQVKMISVKESSATATQLSESELSSSESEPETADGIRLVDQDSDSDSEGESLQTIAVRPVTPELTIKGRSRRVIAGCGVRVRLRRPAVVINLYMACEAGQPCAMCLTCCGEYSVDQKICRVDKCEGMVLLKGVHTKKGAGVRLKREQAATRVECAVPSKCEATGVLAKALSCCASLNIECPLVVAARVHWFEGIDFILDHCPSLSLLGDFGGIDIIELVLQEGAASSGGSGKARRFDAALRLLEGGAEIIAPSKSLFMWTTLGWNDGVFSLLKAGLVPEGPDCQLAFANAATVESLQADRDPLRWNQNSEKFEFDPFRDCKLLAEYRGPGVTCCMLASYYGNSEALVQLLKAGGSVQFADVFSENTALHLACCRANLKCVGVLLQHGADPNAPNFFGWTPLHFAVAAHNARGGAGARKVPAMIARLKEAGARDCVAYLSLTGLGPKHTQHPCRDRKISLPLPSSLEGSDSIIFARELSKQLGLSASIDI